MADLIDRQAAIDAVNKLVEWYKEKWHESRPTSESVIDVLNNLPSAQPERKKGRWLDDQGKEKYDGYCAECSACGGWSEYITDFCPNCGADMRGESE